MKGTQERGFILGSVEEIVLTLDDNAMNLQVKKDSNRFFFFVFWYLSTIIVALYTCIILFQSMSASRFVSPFLDRVQKWEKSLSHISEVVDVSPSPSLLYSTLVSTNCLVL